MERNDGIVRWSPNQSRDEFIRINVNNGVISLYEATGHAHPGKFDYSSISKHSNFQTISGYDWSPIVRGLVGVGTRQGEIHLLKIDDNSNAKLTLPLKIPRTCQAFAFNTTGLLAVGLDRVRHDAGLQIWDVNERLAAWDSSKPGWTVPTLNLESQRRLEASMSVTSIRFFEDSPQTLICGVRNQALKIYDLRDPNITAISFHTRCNNNIAIDYLDTNYFASSTLDLPGLVIFDKRASCDRTTASSRYIEAYEEEKLPWGAVLKLDCIIEGDQIASVKQLRFSREYRGALGVLSTSGQLQVLETKKEYIDPKFESTRRSPELLEIRKSYELERSRSNSLSKKRFEQRIVSFDWIYLGTLDLEARIIGLQANGDFRIFQMPSATTANLLQMIPWAQPHESGESHLTLPKFNDIREREEILGPLHASVVEADVPIFGLNRYGTLNTRIELAIKIKDSIKSQDKIIVHHLSQHGKNQDPDMIGLATTGYLFNCQKNKLLCKNRTQLQDVWEWISGAEEAAKDDGMMVGPLDLSYMGPYYIWTNQLGLKQKSRLKNTAIILDQNQWEYLISELNRKDHRFDFDKTVTARPHHRILCLSICDCLRTEYEVLEEIETLVAMGDFARAAGIALLEERPKLSVEILKRAGSEYLFLAMALDMKIKTKASLLTPVSDWKQALDNETSLKDNPYIRAIYRYVSIGSWESIAEERQLPMRRRLAIALRYFRDEQLTEWLENEMQESINTGNIEGIILSGITDHAISVLANVDISGDFQTAILILSFCYPRYIQDIRCDVWRDAYRAFLNRHKRFIDRVKFDQASIKKSRDRYGKPIFKPAPRQVTIRCLNCEKITANNLLSSNTWESTSSITTGNPLIIAGINAGFKCPRCGVSLPRCAVCLHHVLGQPQSNDQGLSKNTSTSESALNFPSFCMKCKHVMHLEHAILWFSRHDECPIAECQCRCNDMNSR
ncbi:putative WD repeat-containing protein C12G12.01c [Erysiphe neolycopersici]|uniref:Putative WD repeat-containing protein C12G12.01c n=1 Tax=Erysiphe neolycopersici TaxID=212602 RepID=A0A420HDM5_9PEZI|nr:putative WD repeat-containing protein C12G12.01c [Erysiphe neolycopersici]